MVAHAFITANLAIAICSDVMPDFTDLSKKNVDVFVVAW